MPESSASEIRRGSEPPLVSGIIIFLNGANFIEEAIESVLRQTYDHWELLLVDDGSTDWSSEIAQRYAADHPERIRYLEHPGHRNRGKSASRNLGLRHARGEYVAFLDHDDLWLRNKLEEQVAILEAHPEAGLTYGRSRYWHSWTGKPEDRERDGFTVLGVTPDTLVRPPHLVTLFLRNESSVASPCSMLLRREVANRVGGFDELFRETQDARPMQTIYEDMVFFTKLYLEVPVFVAGGCWDCYRQHPDNSTAIAFRTGEWHPRRRNPRREMFLTWVEQYVQEKGLNDAELLEALTEALFPYRHLEERSRLEKYYDACLEAGPLLVRGEDARGLLSKLAGQGEPGLDPQLVATHLFDAVPRSTGGVPATWSELWLGLESRVEEFLEVLEAQAQAAGLALRVLRVLERLVEAKWELRTGAGNQARLVFPSDNPQAVRVDIAQTTPGPRYEIQLNMPRLGVQAEKRYVLHCLARADGPRTIGIGFARAYHPWDNLGLYREVELTLEWQSVEATFVATQTEHNARLHFDLGDSDLSVELSAVTLSSLSEGSTVTPDLGVVAAPSSGESRVRTPPVGKVQFGSFRTLKPISRDWGFDRGLPIDRYYIEKFLARHASEIRGRVLELADDAYTRRFGGPCVTASEVLHATEGNPRATLVGDLTSAEHIPSDRFDCVILTQTLHVVYDVRAALRTLYRILKPAGVLLASLPGLSKIYHDEWAGPALWGFTSASAQRLFEEVFSPGQVAVEARGNVLAAIAFLHGLAAKELRKEELEAADPDFQVLVTVRAVKAGVQGGEQGHG